MIDLYESLQLLGQQSLDIFWFPVFLWSVLTVLVLISLRINKKLNPLYQYHMRVAALLALPLGLISTQLISVFSKYQSAQGNFDPALFIINNPIPQIDGLLESTLEITSINWFESNFVIGAFTILTLAIGALMLVRFIVGFISLNKLRSSLNYEPITNIHSLYGFEEKSVSIAFHDYDLVPFTFGWKKPAIVLPGSIKSDEEKLNMAIQHELVHIRRGDYALQLILSVIQSLFWFHPLIHLAHKDIETYREISCDFEVLSSTNIKPKSYASLLYELLPLHKNYEKLAITMAVKQSTLKQRIATMKNYKTYETSFKRSLVFLFSMVVIIITPIACSDLNSNYQPTAEELESTKFEMKQIVLSVNGKDIITQNSDINLSSNGFSSFIINANEYGVFKISLIKFDDAILAGEVVGNKASFKINELDVQINSKVDFLSNIDKADLWVDHSTNKVEGFTLGVSDPGTPLSEYLKKYMSKENQSEKYDETFVVVEEMPQLIGGKKGLQSKIQYPQEAINKGIEGRVTVQFVVDENGQVQNPQIIRGIGAGCDEEALRVVSQATFTKGKQRGKNVKVKMTLPIIFKLSE